MKTTIPLSHYFCSNIGKFPSHLNITFYNQNYILLYLNNNCIDLRFLMHFVLNGACVFLRVCSVFQCLDFFTERHYYVYIYFNQNPKIG